MVNRKITKKITVIDVAKHSGVSKSTVSLVINGSDKVSKKSQQKVQKAIAELGYVYNREAASLRSRKSKLIAIVINDLTNPFSAQLVVALEQQIRQMGLFVVIVNSGECVKTQTSLVNNLKEYNVAAFILCPAPTTSASWINSLVDEGFTVVNMMREVEGAKVATVLPDNILGAKLATQYVLTKGHKHIVFIGGNETISDYHQRLSGYMQAMSDLKVLNVQSATTRDGGRKAMEWLMKKGEAIDAVVCFNDVVAYGVIETIRAFNLIPGVDIAVIGFDDLEDSRLMSPSLTTVHIDANKIAQAVCHILERKEEFDVNKTLVSVELIARDSA